MEHDEGVDVNVGCGVTVGGGAVGLAEGVEVGSTLAPGVAVAGSAVAVGGAITATRP